MSTGARARRPSRLRAAWWVVVAVVSVWCGRYPSFSRGETVAVAVVGGAVVVVGIAVRRRTVRPRGVDLRGATAWLALVVVFAVIDVVDIQLGSTHAHPSFSVWLAPTLGAVPVRVVAWAAWLLAGGWLVTA